MTTAAAVAGNGGKTTAVLDTYGKPLKAGQNYYIVPTSGKATGGGFTWKRLPKWPKYPKYYVEQLKQRTNFGDPINFDTINPSKSSTIISISSNIKVNFSTLAVQKYGNSNWEVVRSGSDGAKWVVEIGVVRPKILSHIKFTIERHNKEVGYMIKHCSSDLVCGGIGLVYDYYVGQILGVNATYPMAVVFEPGLFFTGETFNKSTSDT
ncbi:sporamin B [Spinacia oleracea]|uniref:Sporamin B n=1 Tax=Spinacia oleracea TaxID=3562 RepID=A0A9R0IAI6_SPIOL|nr:sporamin B-like [Spinacia oleracea]